MGSARSISLYEARKTTNLIWSYHATTRLRTLFFPPNKLASVLLIYPVLFSHENIHIKEPTNHDSNTFQPNKVIIE